MTFIESEYRSTSAFIKFYKTGIFEILVPNFIDVSIQ